MRNLPTAGGRPQTDEERPGYQPPHTRHAAAADRQREGRGGPRLDWTVSSYTLLVLKGVLRVAELLQDSSTRTRFLDLADQIFPRLHSEFEVVLVDLSAGRSYAAEIVIAATTSPALRNVTTRRLVSHRWTQQHILAANGLVFGDRGLLDINAEHGREREKFTDDIRFVRTAIVDPNTPDLTGLRLPQLAWLREANRRLRRLAAEMNVGRSAVLGEVPLDPVLQWRERLLTDSDVWARHVANHATIDAFGLIAKKIIDESALEQL